MVIGDCQPEKESIASTLVASRRRRNFMNPQRMQRKPITLATFFLLLLLDHHRTSNPTGCGGLVGAQATEGDSLSNINRSHGQHAALVKPPSSGTNRHTISATRPRDETKFRAAKPDLRVKRDLYTSEQMDTFYQLFTDIGGMNGSLAQVEHAVLAVRSHSLVFDDALVHRYESYAELKQSMGPHVNQELCLRQLEQLNERLDQMGREKFNSRDLNLYQLLDTYGRVPPGVLSVNVVWPGMYEHCLGMEILDVATAEGGEPTAAKTRYCLASVKRSSWPRDNQLSQVLAFKAGVCLPRACDSIRYKNKYDLIQRLMDFNNRQVDRGQSQVEDLYCLPDEDSPMRKWWRSPWSLQAALVFGSWVAFLVVATMRYERMIAHQRKLLVGSSEPATSSDKPSLGLKGVQQPEQNADLRIYQILSITNNFKLLFSTTSQTTKEPSPRPASGAQVGERPEDGIVDLRCLEGIKVICMTYVIMGHVLMCVTSVIGNGREMASTSSPAFIVANMMPAFAVNAFFTITGILTSYLLSRQNLAHSFMASPVKWATIILYRYLRIMPVYLVVVYYCKYLSKFTGSGPLWDYGTSALGYRRRCEQESWLWTLLFGANFRPALDQCVPSAWYLANDFQFFLVTPMFMLALHRSPAFGTRLLKCCIVAGYLAGVLSMYFSGATDMRPIAKFMPHGFKTYVTFLTASYTRPQYRIPAYLCGLLFGHKLFAYEQARLGHSNKERAASGQAESACWPRWLLAYGSKLSLLFVVLCALIPIVAAQLPMNRFFANLLTAIVMSAYHIMFALGVGLYILLATTGHANGSLARFLSAPLWKPLARMNLCIVLINIEVINYIMQTRRQLVYVDFFSHSALNLLGIAATYLVAAVLYVLFEAPLRGLLTQLLYRAIGRLDSKQKLQ